jgi:hypothetical protein
MLNRSALIIRCKQPFVDWLNSIEPKGEKTSPSEINSDNTVYLIEVEDEDGLEEWLEENADRIFAEELAAWIIDENLWPRKLDLETFKKWFDIQWHSVVMDTGSTPIEDDEARDDEDDEEDEDFEIEEDVEDDPADTGAGRR